MTRRRLLLGAATLALLIAAPIGWYLISPLFITRTVNEDFPVAATAPVMPDQMTATSQAMLAPTAEAMTAQPDAVMLPETPEPMAAKTAAPADEPRLLRTGEFHPVTHNGQGTATIYQLPGGKHVLRLENFEVLNGPDLYVWLSSAPDASNARTILDSQYVSLGRLKGNQGNQNYELPADVDVHAYHSVTIWCRQFSVNFATAPLK